MMHADHFTGREMVYGEPNPTYLIAEGQIPQQTTPTSLSITGLPPADLTPKPPITEEAILAACEPKGTASLPTDGVTLSGANGEATLRLKDITVVKGDTYLESRVFMDLQNLDKLDNFTIDDLQMWMLDDDGVARAPSFYEDPQLIDCSYEYDSLPSVDGLTVGPSQTAELRACFPHRPGHHAAALVIQSRSLGIDEVLGIPPDMEPA